MPSRPSSPTSIAGCLRLVTTAVAGLSVAISYGDRALPHVVIVLADDLGYGDVGCFNPDCGIETPNLDRLADEGVRFTDAHSGAAVCVPSRYALLTGRFAVRAKSLSVRDGPVIEPGRPTIATLLAEHGYATHMVGKWHQGFETLPRDSAQEFDYSEPLRGGPVDRGFASFFGMHASLDIPPYFYIRDRTPTSPPTLTINASSSVGDGAGWNKIQGAFWRAGEVGPDFRHEEVTPRFAEAATDVIRRHAARPTQERLFLYLALPSPHTPWLPTQPFRGKSAVGSYGDFVMQVDDVVGRVVAALDKHGMAGETLLLFSSDNGPVWYDKDRDRYAHDASGGFRGMKFSSWEGGHRVPFIARWPDGTPPGSTSEQTIVFSDIYSTLSDLVGGGPIGRGVAEDSVSFLPHLLNATQEPTERPAIVHDRRTIRDGRWKLILPRRDRGANAEMGEELFDLRSDPGETTNLVEDQPEIVERLRRELLSVVDG